MRPLGELVDCNLNVLEVSKAKSVPIEVPDKSQIRV